LQSIQAAQDMRESAARMSDALEQRAAPARRTARQRFRGARSRFQRVLNDDRLGRPGADRVMLLNEVDNNMPLTQAAETALHSGPLDTRELYNRAQTVRISVNNALDRLRGRNFRTIQTPRWGQERTSEKKNPPVLLWSAMIGAVMLFFFSPGGWRAAARPHQDPDDSAVALGRATSSGRCP